MHSLPSPAPVDTPPVQVLLARWARADACPLGCGNLEVPRGISAGHESHRFHARYRCTDCGHSWTTGWVDD